LESWSDGREAAIPSLHRSNTPIKHFMNQALLAKIESEQFRKDPAEFGIGDSVRVHTKVVEGDKERIQIFTGVVIGRRGHGLNETFTVRRISYGEGVERVFPLHSPRVDRIEVERQGSVRRAKLTYLRSASAWATWCCWNCSRRAAGCRNSMAAWMCSA